MKPEMNMTYHVSRIKECQMDWDLYRKFASQQYPFIIEDAMEHWSATHMWRDLNYLVSKIGHERIVPIEVGRAYTDSEWEQKLVTFDDFVHEYILGNHGRKLPGYLAQHDLFRQFPQLLNDTIPPDYCCLDYGQKIMISSTQIITNCWFGPENTTSPLHTDPYDNLYAQVVGFKYFRLYSPTETLKLYPHHKSSLVANTSQIVDVNYVDAAQYPLFHTAKYVEALLGPGDLLFIPEGWWHYVKSMSTAFSISYWRK